MTTVDDVFQAAANEGEDVSAFSGFVNSALGPPGSAIDYLFGVEAYGRHGGVVGCGGTFMTRLFGPYSTIAGVHGTAHDFTGVAGTSVNHVGVYGQVEDNIHLPDNFHAGVLGAAGNQPGVIGFSEGNAGVRGFSFSSVGAMGGSSGGPGVIGVSDTQNGVVGIAFLTGPAVPNTIDSVAGVMGTSGEHIGVLGTSTNEAGVAGYSEGAVGVYGESGAADAYAGFFRGNLLVTGRIDAGTKDAIVPFSDGSHRLMHCMESPEHWFEDFGAARLKRGRTVIKLDEDFAKVIKRGDYKVFLTPEGNCRGLYVRKSAASFEVRELMDGKSSVAFSYRIVGRRKDIRAHRRFAKFDMPAPPTRARRPAPTRSAFIAELERQARATATPSMRKRDRDFADIRPVNPRRPPRGPAVRKRRDSA